jgi:hypothetical protein
MGINKDQPTFLSLDAGDDNNALIAVHCAGCEKEGRSPFIAMLNEKQNPVGARAAYSILLGHTKQLGEDDHRLTFFTIPPEGAPREVPPPLENGRVVSWTSARPLEKCPDDCPAWYASPRTSRFFQ